MWRIPSWRDLAEYRELSVPYQGFLYWDAARAARLFVSGAVGDDVLV